jgi:hypothetical protein
MGASHRGGARVWERRGAKQAAGPDHLAPETPELAPPPCNSAARRGTDSFPKWPKLRCEPSYPVWFSVFIAGFVIFATLRSLKKRTKLLHVEGR